MAADDTVARNAESVRPADPVPRPPVTARPPRQPVRLVVVGDALLDEDITGDAERISSEAPVLVVGGLRRVVRPGGAGLAATLSAADGHQTTLITALGTDEAARTVLSALREAGVTVVNLHTTSPTAMKTRIRAAGQTILMLDHVVSPTTPGPLPESGRIAIEAATAILVSDYGRGVAACADVREALARVAGRTPVVWDPHPSGPPPVRGITVATPNIHEARHFTSGSRRAGLAGDIARGRELVRIWGVAYVAVTRGAEGAVLVGDETVPPLALPVEAVPGADTRGAGDRFAVVAAALLGNGALLSTAMSAATSSATAFVGDHTAPPAADRSPRADVDAIALAQRVHADGGLVVATGGCFDLLHRGHVALLEQARQLGDCLIVCLNSDASVTRLKGHPRPLIGVGDRVAVLCALSCVDAVVVFEEDTPAGVLARLRPHVYVKGGDYAIGDIPESSVVEEYGGQVVLVPYLDGRSTTSLVQRVERNANLVEPS